MERKTLDRLAASAGAALVALLLVASGLLFWAGTFVSGEVHSQLAAQKIYFPAKDSAGISDPKIKPYLEQYAGQQLTTGPQAKAFADHYIAVHLSAMGGGKTYSQLSTEARANPKDAQLADTVNTVFKGETLRGLLLNAYAFSTMGTIATYAAIASLVGALAFLLLSALGFRHAARASRETAV